MGCFIVVKVTILGDTMRIFITGIDGYLGWTLAQYLVARGHTVAGADTMFRRQWVEELNSQSAIPIFSRE